MHWGPRCDLAVVSTCHRCETVLLSSFTAGQCERECENVNSVPRLSFTATILVRLRQFSFTPALYPSLLPRSLISAPLALRHYHLILMVWCCHVILAPVGHSSSILSPLACSSAHLKFSHACGALEKRRNFDKETRKIQVSHALVSCRPTHYNLVSVERYS